MNSKLTIYILTYNRAVFLKECLDSVLAQTYKNFDVIVLDNGSTDNTEEVMSSFSDSRIRYVKRPKNIGGNNNFLDGFYSCNSDYFMIFHDDDIMSPYLVGNEIELLEKNKDCVVACCRAHRFTKTEEICDKVSINEGISQFSGEQIFMNYIRDRRTFVFPSFMYRTNFLRKNDITLKPDAGPCNDVILYSDIGLAGGIICELDSELMHYRVHPGQDSVINEDAMHWRLFDYLKQDSRYRELLNKYSKEQAYYFRIVRGGVFRDAVLRKYNRKESINRLDGYANRIGHRKIDYLIGKLAINVTSLLPKVSYSWYTKRKMNCV